MEEKIKIDYNSRSTEGLVTEICHPIHIMFKVIFEDGYENIFYTDVDTGRWLEQDLGYTALAGIVGDKISTLSIRIPVVFRKLHWYFRQKNGRSIHFSFYHYLLGGFPVFEIYAPNKRFMFSMILVNKNLWQIFRFDGDWEYHGSDELLGVLPEILENLMKQPE